VTDVPFRAARALRFAALLWIALAGFAARDRAQAQSEPCRPLTEQGNDYVVCEVDLRRYRLRTFWRGSDGGLIGSLERLAQVADPAEGRLAFAMNGGMYHADLAPVGLYVENGQELTRANTANGPGNFHMKPNGIFWVGAGRVGVSETGRYLKERPRAEYATQSGPMLVVNGRIHPKISDQGVSRKIRNGVGVRDANTVVFAISNGPVTFGEFAHLFRDTLRAPNALFLDGSISSLYAPALRRNDGLLPLGLMIGAFEKARR
jgi:uncharacterized protein YigE (DUF2233 family)